MSEELKRLDQFYTRSQIARACVAKLHDTLSGFVHSPVQYIEPAAGRGAFLTYLPKGSIGLDLEPGHQSVRKKDFLFYRGPNKSKGKKIVVVGNPPFGKRGSLALDFCQNAARFADVIAFILPMCFSKYDTQRKMPPDFALLKEKQLASDSFITPDGKPYQVRTVFQIWSRLDSDIKNQRILIAPKREHQDFKLLQYNNTEQALKYFKEPFDFAVPCQGYGEGHYKRRETNPAKCEKTKQWMLFSSLNKKIKKRLKEIDYWLLAQKATTVPGYRKHDVVCEYMRLYGSA